MNVECPTLNMPKVAVPMGRVELTLNDVLRAIRKVERAKFYPELQDLCAQLKRNPSLLHNFDLDFRRLGIWGLALPSDKAKFEALLREYIQYLQAGDSTFRISIRDLADALCVKDAHSLERKARELGVDLSRFPITGEGLKDDQKMRPCHPFFKKHQLMRIRNVQALGIKARQDFQDALQKKDHEVLKGSLIRLKRIRGPHNPLLIEYYRSRVEKRPMTEVTQPRSRELRSAPRDLPKPRTSAALEFGQIEQFGEALNGMLEALQKNGQLLRRYRLQFNLAVVPRGGSRGYSLGGWESMEGGFLQKVSVDGHAGAFRFKDILEEVVKKISAEEGPERLLQAEAFETLRWSYLRSVFAILPEMVGETAVWKLQFRLEDVGGSVYFNRDATIKTPQELCETLRQWKKKGLLPQALSFVYADYTFTAFNLVYARTKEQFCVKNLNHPEALLKFLNRT